MNTNSIVKLKKEKKFWQILTFEDPKFAQNLAQASSRRRFGWILGKFLQRSILPKKFFFLSFTIEFVFTRISYITYVPLQISCRVPLSVLLLYYNPMLDAGGHLPYSNIEIWKLNTPTISLKMCECLSLYKILVCMCVYLFIP